MDTVLPVAGAAIDLCNVDIPLHTRLEGRGKRSVPFSPVHESIAAEVVVHHGLSAATAEENAETAEWGPAFRRHLAAQLKDGRPCFPFALYM